MALTIGMTGWLSSHPKVTMKPIVKASSARRMTIAYLLALSLIALLSAGTHYLLNHAMVLQEDAATVVNIAGRQRMLSQRIALLAQDLDAGVQSARLPLIDAVNLMERSHNALVERNDLGITSHLPAAAAENYFGGAAPLDDKISKFISDARQFADMAPGAARHQLNTVLHEIALNDLLPALDHAVSIFETEANQNVASSLWMQKIVFSSLLLTLVAEALLIFRPMISTVQDHANSLYILATHDSLTNLPNRRFFADTAERLIRLARRSAASQPISALVIDIDNFKQVNDTYGHAVGDAVLKRFGDIVRTTLRTTDVFGRIGGEEFAVVLPDTDLKSALFVSERLRRAVQDDHFETNPLFTISIGVTLLMPIDVGVEDLIHRSDDAMYFAKAQGRNRIAYISGDRPLIYNSTESSKPETALRKIA